MSLFDIDLPELAKNQETFHEIGVRFIGPSVETAMIGNDKLATNLFLKRVGVLSPNTYISLDEASAAIEKGILKFPVIIKPRFGMGSIGIFVAENKMELEVLYKKCLIEIFNSYLSYESEKEETRAVLIQEQLSGEECGLDLFKDLNENLVSIVAKKKIMMRSGETDVGETIQVTPFEEFGFNLGNNLEFSGLLSVDCFLTTAKWP